ncbi:MAG TPA: hypothetical protein VJ044_02330, partial [Candidatus Hodarchaeales archaeon]|nr:hypothetical protein [Candidatus Hodarchaeales archaeon]
MPTQFLDWQEFRKVMPVMERKTIQSNREALISRKRGPDTWFSTGGSTAEPLQIPKWKPELESSEMDIWHARGWYDVKPSDRLFLIWG